MVYNWDDKEAECYRLYVEEKKNLDEVIAYWEARGFTPRYVTARLYGWDAVQSVSLVARHALSDCTAIRATMLTVTSQQASISDTVQGNEALQLLMHGHLLTMCTAMGLPKQAEPGAQEPRPRRPPP